MNAVVMSVLGVIVGSWTGFVSGWFFVITRPYRRTGSLAVIAFGYLVIILLYLGPFLVFREVLIELGISGAFIGDVALSSYVLAMIVGVFIVGRTEIRWRKSAGIGNPNVSKPN